MTESLLFFIFGGLSLLTALYMAITRNVIHGAYALTIFLLAVAGIFVLLDAVFLAVVQLFMYAGGIAVLLIFGVMLTNRDQQSKPVTAHRNFVLSAAFCGLLATLMIRYSTDFESALPVSERGTDATREIGILLMTDYILAFELIAVILLAVLVGASFVSLKSTRDD